MLVAAESRKDWAKPPLRSEACKARQQKYKDSRSEEVTEITRELE